jgi:hypothetical protein
MPLVDVIETRRRIETEFNEMPGLSVTAEQGARLWAVPLWRTVQVLEQLVGAGFLRRNPMGSYLRS